MRRDCDQADPSELDIRVREVDRDGVHELQLVFAATPATVRDALQQGLAGLTHPPLSAEDAGLVELVLAETLNNIVEHAYAGLSADSIALTLQQSATGLSCKVVDNGVPMPGGAPPLGHQSDRTEPLEDLPEGGFGWFLIRSLSRDLKHWREDGRNHLTFSIATGSTLPLT